MVCNIVCIIIVYWEFAHSSSYFLRGHDYLYYPGLLDHCTSNYANYLGILDWSIASITE